MTLRDTSPTFAPKERKWAAVVVRRIKFAIIALAALALSLGPVAGAAADPPKDPPGNGPNNKVPSKRVRGKYVLTIAGYYVGGGEAHATPTGIKISARVKDPDGTVYDLSARKLEIVNDRFTGKGTLGDMEVDIDGRVDPQDRRGEEVLKKGRMTFTFRAANGKHARGAGDQREQGPG
jgi:hypothetical protein